MVAAGSASAGRSGAHPITVAAAATVASDQGPACSTLNPSVGGLSRCYRSETREAFAHGERRLLEADVVGETSNNARTVRVCRHADRFLTKQAGGPNVSRLYTSGGHPMGPSLSLLATTFVVGVLVIGCVSAPSPAPITTPPPSGPPATSSASATPSTAPSVTGSSTKDDNVPPTWIATASMVEHRWNHAATLLTDGRVLVVRGGSDERGTATAEIYDPGTAGSRCSI